MSEILFDRILLRSKCRSAAKNFGQHNFLYRKVANRILEDIEFLPQEFESLLELGARDGYLSDQIVRKKNIKNAVQTDLIEDFFLRQEKNSPKNYRKAFFIADEESLPFKTATFDLIVSNLNFHYINQVRQFLLQVKNILKPGGIFIASFFGENNLHELAQVLYESETKIYHGISPRMPPTIDLKTAANLVAKAGFSNPVSDFEKIEVNYSGPLDLLKDVKAMGQGNILIKRSRRFFTKKFLEEIEQNYRKIYKTENDGIIATFEIITITGWKN
jgi:SAM-dependent methyltransferase